MLGPLIAIVGSVDEARSYDPPIARTDAARTACEELGRELATRKCRIVVYSNLAGFIEADVVRGYVGSQVAEARSIQVRAPYDAGIKFAETDSHREVFDPRPDSSPSWEVSFYRSLSETQGVVLIGGGRSTLVTGLIALAYRLPLLAIATFGGNAKKVWEALERDKALATDVEIAAMAQEWHPGSAARLVDGLLNACGRRDHEEQERVRLSSSFRRRTLVSALIAAVLLVCAVAAIPISWEWEPGTRGALAALMFAPLFAGAAGSIIRVVSDHGRDWTKTAVLGLAAAGVAFLLFVAAQIAATPDILDTDGSRRLLVFGLPMSFIAGLTFDVVYERLRTTDVVQTSAVKSPD